MLPIKTFVCKECGEEFTKQTKSFAWYCPDCRKKKDVEKVMKSRKKYNPEIKVGVGSGGNQWGENNSQWKGGESRIYHNIYRKKGKNSKVCEKCGSDRFLIIHHIDFNHYNNSPENLQKLCRSCHSKIHELHKNFE
ncbi:MAG: HNH endonuclease [Bacilli bacterium]|nr:HNH endonuclease [Bacilli bacterium]